MNIDEIAVIRDSMVADFREGVGSLCREGNRLSNEGVIRLHQIVYDPLEGILREIQRYSQDYANAGEDRRFVVDFMPVYMTLDVHFEMQQGCSSLAIEYGKSFKMVCERLLHELSDSFEENFYYK